MWCHSNKNLASNNSILEACKILFYSVVLMVLGDLELLICMCYQAVLSGVVNTSGEPQGGLHPF